MQRTVIIDISARSHAPPPPPPCLLLWSSLTSSSLYCVPTPLLRLLICRPSLLLYPPLSPPSPSSLLCSKAQRGKGLAARVVAAAFRFAAAVAIGETVILLTHSLHPY